jgi:hypothetical protein
MWTRPASIRARSRTVLVNALQPVYDSVSFWALAEPMIKIPHEVGYCRWFADDWICGIE